MDEGLPEGRLEEIQVRTSVAMALDDSKVVERVGGYTLELVAEVERLNGRLEAVCSVVSDADAFNGVVEANRIMEAVRGE